MINWVEMTNWRAYAKRRVDFQPGLTFVIGPNGVGKTSILEAITYALTGEVLTVKERGKLLRNASSLATVRLGIDAAEEHYLVERSQSATRAETARLFRGSEKVPLAHSHKETTASTERLLGVSPDFLRRIVYMAEGDVFRFLSDPPQDALTLQIQRVLGLTHLDTLIAAIERAEKELKEPGRALAELVEQLQRLGVTRADSLDRQIEERDARRSKAIAALRAKQGTISDLKRDFEDWIKLNPVVGQAKAALVEDPEWSAIAANEPVLRLMIQIERRLDDLRAKMDHQREEAARLEGERTAHARIREVLAPLAGAEGTTPCPVCGKPMLNHERDSAVARIEASISSLENAKADLLRTQSGLSRERERLTKVCDAVRPLRNWLAHSAAPALSPSAPLAALFDSVMEHLGEFQGQLDALETEAAAIEENLSTIEKEKAAYVALHDRLHRLGYSSPENATGSLVRLEARSLSLRAASAAAQETLANQRNSEMAPVFRLIATAWGNFKGDEKWTVKLDTKGLPEIVDGDGKSFDLSQFSGGEKTALLVMIHTIIAHYFSKSRFLLIDEPLEHLDPVNRRSLIKFLVEAGRHGLYEQAIVTTFEESLVRKYLSDDSVHVVHLTPNA